MFSETLNAKQQIGPAEGRRSLCSSWGTVGVQEKLWRGWGALQGNLNKILSSTSVKHVFDSNKCKDKEILDSRVSAVTPAGQVHPKLS